MSKENRSLGEKKSVLVTEFLVIKFNFLKPLSILISLGIIPDEYSVHAVTQTGINLEQFEY